MPERVLYVLRITGKECGWRDCLDM